MTEREKFINYKGKQISPDRMRELLSRLAGRQAPELLRQVQDVEEYRLQEIAASIERSTQPSRPFNIKEVFRQARKPHGEPTVADRVIAGEQVVLKGISKGVPRLSDGETVVVNPDMMIVKVSFTEEAARAGVADIDAYVGKRVQESQEQLRKTGDRLRKELWDINLAAMSSPGTGAEITVLMPHMLKIIDGCEIEVSPEAAKGIDANKPTYAPLFEMTEGTGKKKGRVIVKIKGAREAVELYGINPAWACKRASETMSCVYQEEANDRSENREEREKAGKLNVSLQRAAVELLTNQLPRETGEQAGAWIQRLPEKCNVAARTLPLTLSSTLIEQGIGGLTLELGGRGDHSMQFAEGMPTVLGVHGLITHHMIGTGLPSIIDDQLGVLVINPTPETREHYKRKGAYLAALRKKREEHMQDPVARTRDGVEVRLSANVEFPHQLDTINDYSIPDIGLLRSEAELLAILSRHGGKSLTEAAPLVERDMFEFYRRMIDRFKGRSMSIRDLDVAGRDKVTHEVQRLYPDVDLNRDFIGGLDFIIHARELHTAVLRAIVRAAAHGAEREKRIRLLVPMVSDLGQLQQYQQRLHDEASGLGLPEPPLVAMFENPEGVRLREQIMKEVTGSSIGTNDIIHFMTGIPRGDRRFPPGHPAMIEPVERVVETGNRHGKLVSVCGEAGYDPVCACIMVLAGVRILSGSADMAPQIKELLGQLDTKGHAHLLERSKACGDYDDLTRLWYKEFPPLRDMPRFEEKPPFEIPK